MACGFFDFRDDRFGHTLRGNEFLQRPNIRRPAHETQRDPVNVMRQSELDVPFVFLCEGRERQRQVREIDSLPALEHAAFDDAAAELTACDLHNFEFQ